jgi:hypothetical protein
MAKEIERVGLRLSDCISEGIEVDALFLEYPS